MNFYGGINGIGEFGPNPRQPTMWDRLPKLSMGPSKLKLKEENKYLLQEVEQLGETLKNERRSFSDHAVECNRIRQELLETNAELKKMKAKRIRRAKFKESSAVDRSIPPSVRGTSRDRSRQSSKHEANPSVVINQSRIQEGGKKRRSKKQKNKKKFIKRRPTKKRKPTKRRATKRR